MLGDIIKKLRSDKDITQASLGKALGVSTSMVGMYETNVRKPSYDVLNKIADYFDVTVDYLLGKTNMRDSSDALWIADGLMKTAKHNLEGMSIDQRDLYLDSLELLNKTLGYNCDNPEALEPLKLINNFISNLEKLVHGLIKLKNKDIPESIGLYGELKAYMDSDMNKLLQIYTSEPDKGHFVPSQETLDHIGSTGDNK